MNKDFAGNLTQEELSALRVWLDDNPRALGGKWKYADYVKRMLGMIDTLKSELEAEQSRNEERKQRLIEFESFKNFHNPEMDKLREENKKLAEALWQMRYAGYCLFGDGSWSMDEEPHFKKVYEDCGEILKGYGK